MSVLSDDTTIEDATFNGNATGVYTEGADGLTVADSTFRNHTDSGIRSLHATNTTVARSVFRGNTYGIWMNGDANGGLVEDNRANSNGVGIWIGVVEGVTVDGNTANRNDASGIVVDQDDFNVGFVGGLISGNMANRNGAAPAGFTDLLGAPLDDGIHVLAPLGVVELRHNTARTNGDLGIEAVVATDGGGNTARRNGDAAECQGVVCG